MLNYNKILLKMSDLNKNITYLNNKIQDLKLRLNNINSEYEIDKNSIDNDYLKLFSYIKNIDNDPFDTEFDGDYVFDKIKIDINNIRNQKTYLERKELKIFRIEKELNKNEKEYDLFVKKRDTVLEEQQRIDDLDIREKCEICYNKQDVFISCAECQKQLCVNCYNNIISCPYCRNEKSFK